ncbi:MAG: VOC family protein, partial [Bacteroidetes bacterium]|nr:VOC family protein [Bacteroidota bacterium]
MLNIPTPTLSQVYAFTITSPDLETSSAFYQKLGFKELFRSDFPFPLILISDGSIQIMLRKDPTPYIALSYYVADIEKTVADLEQNGLTFTQKPAEKDLVKRAIFHTPDGATLSLVGFTEGIPQPAGATLLNTAPSDYANTAKYTNQSLGLFGEYAFSVADLGQSIQFWEKLGFAVLHKTDAPRTWAILSDG